MKWCLNTYQTGQDWTLDELIQNLVAADYPGVEVLMDYKQGHGIEWNSSDDAIAQAKRKFAEAGLEVTSLTSCQTFDKLDDGEPAASIGRMKRVVEMAQEFGCRNVRVLGDRLPEGEKRAQVIAAVTDGLRDLGDFAAPKGIAVSIEMHGHFTDPELAMKVVEGADRPNVGVIYNCPGSDVKNGSVAHVYRRVKPYLKGIHMHQIEDPDWPYAELFRLLLEDRFQGYVANEAAYRGPDVPKVLRMYTALFHAYSDR